MYPTEGDFANVFESYVHKDDDISMSKVVLTDGDGNTTTLNNVIGNKADKTDLTEITNRLTTAENDIDTAEDNIAGHETRIQSLEAFKERVRAFLEDADASEETINRWHEIESFLQGITDTQTLTGLLNDLKQEILQSIPQSQQGNYLQLIDDLDAYTDAPVGTIVKYNGPTNNKYTHGFDYEKVAGEAYEEGSVVATLNGDITSSPEVVVSDRNFVESDQTMHVLRCDYGYVISSDSKPQVGDLFLRNDDRAGVYTITAAYPSNNNFECGEMIVVNSRCDEVVVELFVNSSGDYLFNMGSITHPVASPFTLNSKRLACIGGVYSVLTPESTTIQGGENLSTPASWQPCKSMSVID